MWALFLFLFYVAWDYNFNLDYYHCGASPLMPLEESMCKNPFYKPSDWKNVEYLAPGEYGTKLDGLFQWVTRAPWILFGFGLVLNHLLHNRKYKFGEVKFNDDDDDIGPE